MKNAGARGAIGVIIFSDPADYAPEGTAPAALYPHGPGIPSSGAQRGSIFLWKGDPETPDWGSGRAAGSSERIPESDLKKRLPGIPAMPISWGNAKRILLGLHRDPAPDSWQGKVPGVPVYRTGPGPAQVDMDVKVRGVPLESSEELSPFNHTQFTLALKTLRGWGLQQYCTASYGPTMSLSSMQLQHRLWYRNTARDAPIATVRSMAPS